MHYIKTVVKAVEETGLIILGMVCDQTTTNVAAINRLLLDSQTMLDGHIEFQFEDKRSPVQMAAPTLPQSRAQSCSPLGGMVQGTGKEKEEGVQNADK